MSSRGDGENTTDKTRADDAEKDDVGAERGEILEAARQCIPDVVDRDPPHRRGRRIEPAGTADRLDGMAGEPQLIHGPFNGISDMHRHVLPNHWFDEGSRAA